MFTGFFLFCFALFKHSQSKDCQASSAFDVTVEETNTLLLQNVTGSSMHLSLQLYIALFIHSYQLFFFFFFLNIVADYREAKKIQGSFQR